MRIEKQVDIAEHVKATLERFSFVQWDRFVAGRKNWSFYGWIARSDAHEDFLILDFWANGKGKLDIWFLTSSKRYDAQIKRILNQETGLLCKRVEHYFDIPNAIRLESRLGRSLRATSKRYRTSDY
jgi:hypothetical protein